MFCSSRPKVILGIAIAIEGLIQLTGGHAKEREKKADPRDRRRKT